MTGQSCSVDKYGIKTYHCKASEETEFLTYYSIYEVRCLNRQEVEGFEIALKQTLAEKSAGAYCRLCLQYLIGRLYACIIRMQESRNSLLLIIVKEPEQYRQRNYKCESCPAQDFVIYASEEHHQYPYGTEYKS